MKKSMISLFLIIFITCLCIGDIHAETIRMKQVYVPEKQVSIAFPEYYITCEKEDTELDTRLVAEGITLTGMKNLFKKYNSIYIYGFPPDFDGDLNVAISYTPGVSSLAELDQITLNLLRNSYEKQLSGAEIKLLSREEVQIGDNLFFVGKIHKTDLNMDCIQYMTIVDEQTISITLTCGNISAEREDMLKQMVEASTFNKHIAGEVEPTEEPQDNIQDHIDQNFAQIKKIAVGDTVLFGHYEQDGDLGNGKEDIEWLALDVQGENALLISKYSLDAKVYDNAWREVTWETCSLRKWLNEDFIGEAFNRNEQEAILITKVDNSQAQGYSGWTTNSGNDTEDRIFLLSYSEAWRYFPDDESRVCSTTNWAIQKGAVTGTTTVENACVWWLRSPGDAVFRAFVVNGKGTGYGTSGVRVDREGGTVRPALWVRMQLDSDSNVY